MGTQTGLKWDCVSPGITCFCLWGTSQTGGRPKSPMETWTSVQKEPQCSGRLVEPLLPAAHPVDPSVCGRVCLGRPHHSQAGSEPGSHRQGREHQQVVIHTCAVLLVSATLSLFENK